MCVQDAFHICTYTKFLIISYGLTDEKNILLPVRDISHFRNIEMIKNIS